MRLSSTELAGTVQSHLSLVAFSVNTNQRSLYWQLDFSEPGIGDRRLTRQPSQPKMNFPLVHNTVGSTRSFSCLTNHTQKLNVLAVFVQQFIRKSKLITV